MSISDTPRRKFLKGHEPLSSTTIHGWPAVAFGSLFAVMGAPILGVGLEWVPSPQGAVQAPLWVIQACGGIFSGCGLWLVFHGCVGLRRIWNIRHGQQRLPTNPWLWDYPWSAKGITDRALRRALGSLAGLCVFMIFLAPFNWLAFLSPYQSWFWKIAVGLLDSIILLGVGSRILSTIRQYVVFGNAYAAFHRFPFFLGETLDVTLKGLPTDTKELVLTLRCIEEAYEMHGSGENRKSVVVCYQRYGETQSISKENLNLGNGVDVSWLLPDDKSLTSTPSERPAMFWELDLKAERPGFTYQSRFLLPIYAKHA